MTIIDESTEDINSDPFSRPFIDNYCSERESPVYLTREDILELGFLRTNPEREIWRHKDKPTLILQQYTYKDYSVKDLAVVGTMLYKETFDNTRTLLYNSSKPNKEDIQQVINNYAA